MRKLLLAAAGIGIAASVMATPAQAGCFTPSGGPFPTFQVCLGPDIEIKDIIRG